MGDKKIMAEKRLQARIERELYSERIQWMANNLEMSEKKEYWRP